MTRWTTDELTPIVRTMLTEKPMNASEIIEELCTGPQEPEVRHAIMRVLGEEGSYLDGEMAIRLQNSNLKFQVGRERDGE